MRTTEALGAILAGEAEIDGETVEITAEGLLADLAARIASLGSAPEPVEPPPGLTATLRPYQQRGVAWLSAMCDLGWVAASPTTWAWARRCRSLRCISAAGT